MNEAEILKAVNNIRSEKRLKYANGKPKMADEAYFGCIEALISILQTGDVTTEYAKDAVMSAIDEFNEHVDLGIIIEGRFSPIPPHQAAIHNIRKGSIISGNKFPVLKKMNAIKILNDPDGAKYPEECTWDFESGGSLITKMFWYKRHPDSVLGLSESDRIKYKLEEVYLETLINLKDN